MPVSLVISVPSTNVAVLDLLVPPPLAPQLSTLVTLTFLADEISAGILDFFTSGNRT